MPTEISSNGNASGLGMPPRRDHARLGEQRLQRGIADGRRARTARTGSRRSSGFDGRRAQASPAKRARAPSAAWPSGTAIRRSVPHWSRYRKIKKEKLMGPMLMLAPDALQPSELRSGAERSSVVSHAVLALLEGRWGSSAVLRLD